MRLALAIVCLGLTAAGTMEAAERAPISFDERIEAQEKIERVYYARRIWPQENPSPKPPFEKMMTRSQIERKVEEHLKKCAALAAYWNRQISPIQLQAELDRIVLQTKDPEALHMVFEALGNDPYLIAECFVRPLLADREIRRLYARDRRFHERLRREAEQFRNKLTPENFIALGADRYEEIECRASQRIESSAEENENPKLLTLSGEDFNALGEEYPAEGCISQVIETDDAFIIRWTKAKGRQSLTAGSIVFRKTLFEVWLKECNPASRISMDGAPFSYRVLPVVEGRLAMLPDQWKHFGYAPPRRFAHSAIWTGKEMIVWGGGVAASSLQNTGVRYDPATDSWAPTSVESPCPSPRSHHTAVWTGKEMVVWGGEDDETNLNTGGRYDPQTDSWSEVPTGAECPSGRSMHSAVWTGSEMIIWGGWETPPSGETNTGGRYNPLTGKWRVTSLAAPCPSPRGCHTAIWNGSEMIVWGGSNIPHSKAREIHGDGARYDPVMDVWIAISKAGTCPEPRFSHTAIWTGETMVIWGGEGNNGLLSTGGRYDPASDTWAATATDLACPSPRKWHTAIWTGKEMIIWGGGKRSEELNTGSRYDPVSNVWANISAENGCPSARRMHTAVWTGTEMFVWGGTALYSLNTGGRYDPVTDIWRVTYSGFDDAWYRHEHTAIWTGAEMIIWGGRYWAGRTNRGVRYDPATNSWSATSVDGECPTSRVRHTAIWTGKEMIIWGGDSEAHIGGRYDPSTDLWKATADPKGPPYPTYDHTAVWTGTKMIIWGGEGICSALGGMYDPELDTWKATNWDWDTPDGRYHHAAVWTGTEMIVWGGIDAGFPLNDGGRYNPKTDTWIKIAPGPDSLSKRSEHSALWIEGKMIVWGGTDGKDVYYRDGWRFDVDTGEWSGISLGPESLTPRSAHHALWTGKEMIIWGGFAGYGEYDVRSGARYNPLADSWIPISAGEQSDPVYAGSTAVWTGSSMIIWGGGSPNQEGYMYFPYCPLPEIVHSSITP